MIELNTETHVTRNVWTNVFHNVYDTFRYNVDENIWENIHGDVDDVHFNSRVNVTYNIYADLRNHTKLK